MKRLLVALLLLASVTVYAQESKSISSSYYHVDVIGQFDGNVLLEEIRYNGQHRFWPCLIIRAGRQTAYVAFRPREIAQFNLWAFLRLEKGDRVRVQGRLLLVDILLGDAPVIPLPIIRPVHKMRFIKRVEK